MSAGFSITVRNADDKVIEYHTGKSVLHIDVPEGRYVITVSCEAMDTDEQTAPSVGTLQ